MTFKVKSGQITAKYMPAGFSQAEVQKVVATQCNGGAVANVQIEQVGDKAAFVAMCSKGGKYSYSFGEAEKTTNGTLIETTFTDSSGNIKYSSQTL